MSSPSLVAAVMLARYWLTIWPLARRELRAWRRCAEAIPDPQLRQLALATHHEEHLNAEGAAIFATLVPWRRTARLVRLLVAYQVLFDYLDTISEQPPAHPHDTRRLHSALIDALDPLTACSDWYGLHPRHDDGGYVAALVATCRASARRLPAFALVKAAVRRAAVRAGEVQAINHGPASDRAWSLAAWGNHNRSPVNDLRWWELAASASSSLAIHALLALAACNATTADVVGSADGGYCLKLGALNTLLESLVDLERDARTGDHSFARYYADSDDACDRLATIAADARSSTASLPAVKRHVVILAGMVGFYLSTPQAWSPQAHDASSRTLAAIGAPAPQLIRLLRVRRAFAADDPANLSRHQ